MPHLTPWLPFTSQALFQHIFFIIWSCQPKIKAILWLKCTILSLLWYWLKHPWRTVFLPFWIQSAVGAVPYHAERNCVTLQQPHSQNCRDWKTGEPQKWLWEEWIVWNNFGKGLMQDILTHGRGKEGKTEIKQSSSIVSSPFLFSTKNTASSQKDRWGKVRFHAALYYEFQSTHGTIFLLLVLVIFSFESEVSCLLQSFGWKYSHNCTDTGFRTFLALQLLIPGTAKRHLAIKILAELSQPQMMFSVGSDQVSDKGSIFI